MLASSILDPLSSILMASPSNDRPAILGGSPTCPAGPPDWPIPDDDVRLALDAAYHDDSWGKYHGGNVARLEQELVRYHDVEFALTCSSGTLAVELALRAVKVAAGDEVILAAYDYPGNFLSVHAIGAQPVLVDVDRDNWNMAPGQLDRVIGPKTRAIIVSHLHGGVVPVREVAELARHRGVAVIEDAAQMPGATIEGRRAGTWGDVGTLSFGGSKLLTAGRGGALITSSKEFHHRAKLISQRGNHVYPLSELQAAVLLPQLAKLEGRSRVRAENVRALCESIEDLTGLRPFRNAVHGTEPGYYKLGFQFDSETFGGLSRDRFVEAARAEGIAMDAGFRSLHAGRSGSRYRSEGELAEAERAHHGAVVLHHPVLLGSPADIAQVEQAVRKIHEFRMELQTADSPGPGQASTDGLA